jgi:hypothetical protein
LHGIVGCHIRCGPYWPGMMPYSRQNWRLKLKEVLGGFGGQIVEMGSSVFWSGGVVSEHRLGEGQTSNRSRLLSASWVSDHAEASRDIRARIGAVLETVGFDARGIQAAGRVSTCPPGSRNSDNYRLRMLLIAAYRPAATKVRRAVNRLRMTSM